MRWFVFEDRLWLSSRSKKIGIARMGRLALESLEERQCFASDTFTDTSPCAQFREAQHELLSLEFVELGSNTLASHSENANGSCTDEPVDPEEPVEDVILVGDASVVLPDENDSLNLGNQPHPGGLPLVGDSAADSGGRTGPSVAAPPRSEQSAPSDFVYGPTAGQAGMGSAPDRMGSNGSDGQINDDSAKLTLPSAPVNEPFRNSSTSRPNIQKVTELQVTLREPTLGMGRLAPPTVSSDVPSLSGNEMKGNSSSLDRLTVDFSNVKQETLKPRSDQVKTELLAEGAASFGRELGRPNIAKVIALTPFLGPNDKTGLVRSESPKESPSKRHIPSKAIQVSVRTLSIKGDLVGGGALTFAEEDKEARNEPAKEESHEKKPGEKESTTVPLNPLYFVVLVGLIGLPQSVRHRLVKRGEDRDKSLMSGPIEIVPFVGELEPGAENNF